MIGNAPPPHSEPLYKRTLPYRVIRHLLKPLWLRIKHRSVMQKYSRYADSRSFDWNWNSTNYNRIAVVNLLLSKKLNPAYLEIGCAANSLFDSVPVLNKIGVDPNGGGTIRETSDKYFEQNESRFDVVFIDGLHTYEQVRRDVINSIAHLNDGGWVAVHDLLPRNWIEDHLPFEVRDEWTGYEWTGDVWKVAFELAQTEGIDFKILKIDYGVGVFRLLRDRITLKDLTGELREKPFSFFYENVAKLPIVEWEEAQHWLRD